MTISAIGYGYIYSLIGYGPPIAKTKNNIGAKWNP